MYMLNDEKVRTLTLPVLFISGRQDKLVPPSHMDVLYSVRSTLVYPVRKAAIEQMSLFLDSCFCLFQYFSISLSLVPS